MVQTVIKVKGAEAIARKISQISKELKDMKTPMRQVSVMLDQWVQKNFATEGGKVGGWEKLKAGGRYRKGKKKKSGKRSPRIFDASAKILSDTGRLKSSFKPFFSIGNAGIGSELPYSKAHEEGTDKLPQRRILPKGKEVAKKVSEILDWFVKRVIKK